MFITPMREGARQGERSKDASAQRHVISPTHEDLLKPLCQRCRPHHAADAAARKAISSTDAHAFRRSATPDVARCYFDTPLSAADTSHFRLHAGGHATMHEAREERQRETC